MTINFFQNPEQFADWACRQADMIEQNGLRMARMIYDQALAGINRTAFLEANNIPDEIADREWAHHIEWLQDQVKHLEKKVRKYRRDAQKALAQ